MRLRILVWQGVCDALLNQREHACSLAGTWYPKAEHFQRFLLAIAECGAVRALDPPWFGV